MKKIAAFLIKFSVAAGLIWWLIASGRIDPQAFAAFKWTAPNLTLIAAGILSIILGLSLMSLRLRLLMKRLGFELQYHLAFKLTCAGAFLGAVLPGLVGGDALKAAYVCTNLKEQRVAAAVGVFADRVYGLVSVMLLGACAVLAGMLAGNLPVSGPVLIIAPALFACALIFGFLIVSPAVFNSSPVQWCYTRLPAVLRTLIDTVRVLWGDLPLTLQCVGLSLVNHLLIIVTFVIAERLLAAPTAAALLPLSSHMVLDPLAMSLNAVPITPGGLGLTEGAFELLYGRAGSAFGAEVGLWGRLIQYLAFTLTGALSLLLLKYNDPIDSATAESDA